MSYIHICFIFTNMFTFCIIHINPLLNVIYFEIHVLEYILLNNSPLLKSLFEEKLANVSISNIGNSIEVIRQSPDHLIT